MYTYVLYRDSSRFFRHLPAHCYHGSYIPTLPSPRAIVSRRRLEPGGHHFLQSVLSCPVDLRLLRLACLGLGPSLPTGRALLAFGIFVMVLASAGAHMSKLERGAVCLCLLSQTYPRRSRARPWREPWIQPDRGSVAKKPLSFYNPFLCTGHKHSIRPYA